MTYENELVSFQRQDVFSLIWRHTWTRKTKLYLPKSESFFLKVAAQVFSAEPGLRRVCLARLQGEGGRRRRPGTWACRPSRWCSRPRTRTQWWSGWCEAAGSSDHCNHQYCSQNLNWNKRMCLDSWQLYPAPVPCLLGHSPSCTDSDLWLRSEPAVREILDSGYYKHSPTHNIGLTIIMEIKTPKPLSSHKSTILKIN